MQGSPQNIPRLVSHKTRLFGQSHWVSPSIILFRDLIALLEKGDTTQAFADIQRCKALGKVVKTRRCPPWPTIPTPELPAKQVADALVECYLQTTETLYRVLHIPTFQRAYDALWVPGNNRDMAVIMQVKLVMAIGTTTYDDEFSLRTSAIRWIHEAMVWNSDPETYKSRLTIQGLQNSILLVLAQSVVGVGKDMVWPSAGLLVRTAIQMGFHRDPSRLQPPIGMFAAQMRRRLWNTVIELALQTSFDTGGPVLLSLDDFDTSPPANFNDVDLVETDSSNPTPSPTSMSILTQTTIPIAFRHSFPQRLAIVRFLNGLPSSSPEGHYATTLALDSALQTAYRTLAKTLRPFSSSSSSGSHSLAIPLIDILTRRYLLALHVPFLEPALTNHPSGNLAMGLGVGAGVEKFLYSRNAALENALRIWNATKPIPIPCSSSSSSSTFSFPSDFTSPFDSPDDVTQNMNPSTGRGTNTNTAMIRLITNGAPLVRTLLLQSVFVSAAELRAQLVAERESLVSTPVRSDLVSVVREAEEWALRCIRVGETNVKGFLFLRLVRTQIEFLTLHPHLYSHSDSDSKSHSHSHSPNGMEMHVDGDEKQGVERLIKAAEEAGKIALRLMEDMAGTREEEGSGEEVVDFQMTVSFFFFFPFPLVRNDEID